MVKLEIEPWKGFSPELGLLVATWQDGLNEWLDHLGTPSPEAMVWQMTPNGPSIGGLFLHIAGCELFWLQEVGDGESVDPTDVAWAYDSELDQFAGQWPTPPAESFEWYLSMLKEHRHASYERVARHSDPNSIHERWDIQHTYRWIVAHLLEHDSYHGGQAVLLHEAWKVLSSRSA